MGEICSTYPTAGGLYYLSAKLARKNAPLWSWFTVWFDLIGQIGVIASVDFAFTSVLRHGDDFRLDGPGPPLDEIVSMTTTGNTKSRRVMEKIGLHRDPADDFDHPGMLERAPHLARSVLYRVSRDEWAGTRGEGDVPRS